MKILDIYIDFIYDWFWNAKPLREKSVSTWVMYKDVWEEDGTWGPEGEGEKPLFSRENELEVLKFRGSDLSAGKIIAGEESLYLRVGDGK